MSERKEEGDEELSGEHNHEPSRKKLKSASSNSLDYTSNFDISPDSASSGIIEYVTVKNFMCHDHLTFPFSPNINFIQGRNGSGKSAVLTGLVVGLGGSSRLTNRGNSLKELVKYGKQIATIEIAIKNCGKDAFQHDLYGDAIIVERKIFVTGGGNYKLMSKNKKTISVKKEDLKRLLDHFNMQVDNPITVLNQDMSRAFLNSTDPHVLYKFFLKATQLQQMKDEYSQLDNVLRNTTELLEDKEESLQQLEKEVEEYRIKREFSITLNEKRKRLSELRRELAWAMIIEKENGEVKAQKELEACKKMKEKAQTKIDTLQNKLKDEEEMHKSSQETFDKVTSKAKSVSRQVQSVNEKVIWAKREVKDKEGHQNTAQRKIREIKKELFLLQEAVDKANTDARSQWAVRRTQWNEKVNHKKQEQEHVRQDAHTEETHCLNLTNTLELKKDAFAQLNMEDKAIRRKMGGLEQELKGLKGQQGNQFTVFGQWAPQLITEINAAHRIGSFSKKPVGPLGAFVKLRDNSWGHVAEAVLGSRINAFCVDNRGDEQVLRKIMNGINFGRQQQPFVIVCRFREQVHNVSKFEVQSEKYPSLWSVLMINDTVVANTVIDQMQVESILLIPTAEEAGQLLKDKGTVPTNCKVAYTLNRDIYYPDPNYRLYSGRGKQPARFLQVSVEQKVKEIQAELEGLRTELMTLTHTMVDARSEIQMLEEEVRASNRKSQGHKKRLDGLRFKLVELQNQEEPPPPDMSQLEDDLKHQQTRLTQEEDALSTTEEEIETSNKRFAEVKLEYENLRKEEKILFHEAERITEEVNQFASNTGEILTAISTVQRKYKDIMRQDKELENAVKTASENLSKELEAADKLKPRIDTTRSVEDVKRQHDSLEVRLNKERAQSGDPVAIAERYKASVYRYHMVAAEIHRHSKLIKEIQTSLYCRQERYKKFRKVLSVMIKSNFKVHLSTRNLQGALDFDFGKNTLSLHVTQMNNEDNSLSSRGITRSGKQSKKSDVQSKMTMMSGGERSFSTVSFIIALWDVIESPIRILDEFDVFMDVVARSRAMKMMIQSARPKTQYIYLTPLELDTTTYPNISVFKMQDPERDGNRSSQN